MVDSNRPTRPTIDANIRVSIKESDQTKTGKKSYEFAYAGDFVDKVGNIDLTVDGARKRAVRVRFEFDPSGAPGAKFLTPGDNAFWIAAHDELGADRCPKGPYKGNQFVGISTQGSGNSLSFTDKNDDGKVYRYALRFNIGGDTVIDDPEVRNGSDHP